MKSIKLILLAAVLTLSCEDDIDHREAHYENSVKRYREASYKNALENLKFSCMQGTGSSYFKGKINATYFCITGVIDGYKKIFGVYNLVVTPASNPTVDPLSIKKGSHFEMTLFPRNIDEFHSIIEEFKPWVFINTPFTSDTTFTAEKHLDVFKEGPIDIKKGFEFSIGWSTIFLPDYNYYKNIDPDRISQAQITLSPKFTNKSHNFDLVSLVKTKANRKIYYRFVFNINCQLMSNTDGKIAYYGELKDGEYVYELEIDEE